MTPRHVGHVDRDVPLLLHHRGRRDHLVGREAERRRRRRAEPRGLRVLVEALHHGAHDGHVGLTREDQVGPRPEHALEIVGPRWREDRVHRSAAGGRREAARGMAREAVHLCGHLGQGEPGPYVDRVDVGPCTEDRPDLREGLVLVQRVAPRKDGGRTMEEIRDPEGQRTADHVLLAQRADDRVGRLTLVDRDHHLGTRRTEGVRLQLVPESEGQDEDEQHAADGGHHPAAAAHPGGPGRPALCPGLRPLLAGGLPPAPAVSCVSSVPCAGDGCGHGNSSSVSSGPLIRGPARPAAAPSPPRCRSPCAPPFPCARPPAATVAPPRW